LILGANSIWVRLIDVDSREALSIGGLLCVVSWVIGIFCFLLDDMSKGVASKWL